MKSTRGILPVFVFSVIPSLCFALGGLGSLGLFRPILNLLLNLPVEHFIWLLGLELLGFENCCSCYCVLGPPTHWATALPRAAFPAPGLEPLSGLL